MTNTKAGKAHQRLPRDIVHPNLKGIIMKNEKNPVVAQMPPPRGVPAPGRSVTSRLWRRLPTIVKIVLTVPLVMALLGAEIELHLAPQIDAILTAAGVWAMWAWLAGGPLAAM
jgi:hypothetical protein